MEISNTKLSITFTKSHSASNPRLVPTWFQPITQIRPIQTPHASLAVQLLIYASQVISFFCKVPLGTNI